MNEDDDDREPPDNEPNYCPRCYGSGEITTQEPYGEESWTCPACAGSGN